MLAAFKAAASTTLIDVFLDQPGTLANLGTIRVAPLAGRMTRLLTMLC